MVLIESLARRSAAVIMSGVSAGREPHIIRTGSARVVTGLVVTAPTLPGGMLWAAIFGVIVLNGGMDMMWGYISKRVIGAAPATEKDRASSMLPITQQMGFALGAALCGLIANSLGIESFDGPEDLKPVAFWLFAGFVPLALFGNWLAWRFVAPPRPLTSTFEP